MSERTQVLDHGYVEAIEGWGSDERIIEAARMSTGKGFLGWGPIEEACGCLFGMETCPADAFSPSGERRCSKCQGSQKVSRPGDEKLLRFLYENNHATPFEMGGLVIEVQAPIFVFREWHRHRTQSYNEMSARYTPLPDINYIPSVERLMINAGATNKQAGTVAGAKDLTPDAAEQFRGHLQCIYDDAQQLYEHALDAGVPKELARIHLPVGRYSRMRASANLRNWLAFLTLRKAANAQWEIRQYADAVGELIAERFPRTWALFVDGRRG